MLPLLSKNLNLCFSIVKRPLLPHSNNSATSSGNPTMKSISDPSNTEDSDSDTDMLEIPATPDLTTIQASHRFFFSSPGRSNSIVDSSSTSESLSLSEFDETSQVETGGGVAVQTYSPDPYGDFRRSMEEMVEARGLHDVDASWKSLHELLLCYLSLNPKATHKFIVAAFSDLLVSLLSPPRDGGAAHRPPVVDCGFSSD